MNPSFGGGRPVILDEFVEIVGPLDLFKTLKPWTINLFADSLELYIVQHVPTRVPAVALAVETVTQL